jgi:hypothetical protein
VKRGVSAAAILLLAGCFGYSTRSLLPSHLKTVGITPVLNSTTQPGLAEQLNDALPQAFNADRSLRVTNLEAANLVLNATVSGYSRDAASYTGDQAVSAYKVTVSAQVDVRDQVRDEDFYSGPASASITYDPGARTEEQAASEAVSKLASEIVRQVLIAW